MSPTDDGHQVRIQGSLKHRHILRLLSCLEDEWWPEEMEPRGSFWRKRNDVKRNTWGNEVHSTVKSTKVLKRDHLLKVIRLMVQKSCTTWDVKNPVRLWDKLPINWCRITEPSTVLLMKMKSSNFGGWKWWKAFQKSFGGLIQIVLEAKITHWLRKRITTFW